MIYGTRLRQAREFSKLTQLAVAQEINFNQGRLSQAERDRYALPEHVLTEYATLTGFPVAFFLTPPQVSFRDEPLHFRSRASMSAKDANQAECAGEIVAEAALSMLARLHGPDLHIRATVGAEPADAARAARDMLGLSPDTPATGLPVLLEHCGALVIAVPVPGERRDAYSLWLDERPILALLDTDAGDRQLWSTAHELGHLLLHRGAGADRLLEEQADEFAMHFLTPLRVIDKEIPDHPTIRDFALLKRRWGISIAALIRTARRLGKVDDHRYASLFKQMSARGERLRERAAITPTKPRGFRAMAETLYGLTPAQPLAKEANWTEAFAEDVLTRHATGTELPVRAVNNVVSLGARRRAR